MAKTQDTASATTAEAAAPARTLPDFQEGTAYEVLMARAVEFPPGTGNWLRPDHKVTVDGAVAAQIEEHILVAGIAATA